MIAATRGPLEFARRGNEARSRRGTFGWGVGLAPFLALAGCSPSGAETAGGSDSETGQGSGAVETGETTGPTGAVPTGGGSTDGAGGMTGGGSTDSSGAVTGGPGDTSDVGTGGPGDTSGDGTGDSSGTGGVCEDPSAPGCIACDAAPGQPQRLFGLTWNYAQGQPGTGLGTEELRCIVPGTGVTGLVVGIPGMDWLPVGSNAYDREASILYALAFANSDNITRIFSIQTVTGELLGNPALAGEFNWSGGLHVRSDGALVGVTWNQDQTQEEVRIIDPATGATSLVAPVPEIESLQSATYAYDRVEDVIYMIGTAKGDADMRLFAVDAEDGSLLGDPAFVASPGWSGGIHVRADGQLIGVGWVWSDPNQMAGVEKLFTIDAATAKFEPIAEIPGLLTILLGGHTYDDIEDTIYIVDGDYHLFEIDATSGAVLAKPKLDSPNPDSEYNWSGGLHVR